MKGEVKTLLDSLCVPQDRYTQDLGFIFGALEHNRQVGESVQRRMGDWEREVQERENEEYAEVSSSSTSQVHGTVGTQRHVQWSPQVGLRGACAEEFPTPQDIGLRGVLNSLHRRGDDPPLRCPWEPKTCQP